jgi:hypothetical protein
VTLKLVKFVALSTVVALSASCGEVSRSGRSPVQVVMRALEAARGDTPDELSGNLLSDVIVMRTTPDPCTDESPCPTIYNDIGSVEMALLLKDPGSPGVPSTPSGLNQVTINRYRVEYRRTDGRNAPGVDVPYPFDSGLTFTVPNEGQVTAGFEIVRHSAKSEAPLMALRFNGQTINAIATVTFYGQDQAGNEIIASGNIGVNFGDWGDPAN